MYTSHMKRCPGQEFITRDPDRMIYHVDCELCGSDVEFFHDDAKRTCDECGEIVQPDLETLMRFHNCATTCQSAYECLGEEKYLQLYFMERREKEKGEKEKGLILKGLDAVSSDATSPLRQRMEENLQRGYLLDMRSDLADLDQKDHDRIYQTLREVALNPQPDHPGEDGPA